MTPAEYLHNKTIKTCNDPSEMGVVKFRGDTGDRVYLQVTSSSFSSQMSAAFHGDDDDLAVGIAED